MTADDEQYARRLRERYAVPVFDVDPEVIVRLGRRRRGAWAGAGAALFVAGVAAGLMLGGVERDVDLAKVRHRQRQALAGPRLPGVAGPLVGQVCAWRRPPESPRGWARTCSSSAV